MSTIERPKIRVARLVHISSSKTKRAGHLRGRHLRHAGGRLRRVVHPSRGGRFFGGGGLAERWRVQAVGGAGVAGRGEEQAGGGTARKPQSSPRLGRPKGGIQGLIRLVARDYPLFCREHEGGDFEDSEKSEKPRNIETSKRKFSSISFGCQRESHLLFWFSLTFPGRAPLLFMSIAIVRKVSQELLYIAKAPQLKLGEDDFVQFPDVSHMTETFDKTKWKVRRVWCTIRSITAVYTGIGPS